MKKLVEFVMNILVGGLLIIVPIYLAVLLMMKAMASVGDLVRPLSRLVPDWLPAEKLLSLLLVLLVCFLVGAAVRTRRGQAARELLEKTFFERIPGYATIRSLTHRMAGDESERVWKPAFAEIEEALVPVDLGGVSGVINAREPLEPKSERIGLVIQEGWGRAWFGGGGCATAAGWCRR